MKLFILIIFLFSSPVWAMSTSKKLDSIRASEPSFSEVMNEAFSLDHLNRDEVLALQKKIKVAPYLPTLSFGYDRYLKETNAIAINDNISVTSDAVNIGPEDNNLDQSVYEGNVFRIRAVWQLDEIIFHRSTLNVAQEGREISKSRLQLSDYLFKIYSKRRELLVLYFKGGGQSGAKGVLLYEQIVSLADELDAFTNGVFTKRWWREI